MIVTICTHYLNNIPITVVKPHTLQAVKTFFMLNSAEHKIQRIKFLINDEVAQIY